LEKPLASKRFSGGSASRRTPFRWPHPATGNAWIWETGSAKRQQGACKSLGLTWKHFCQQLSPDSFRRIAPAVHGDSIAIAGELVPITPENALKIKQAVLAW